MAKFKYRMQNILDIKQKLEESAKMEFGEANVRVMEEEERLAVIDEKKQAYETEGGRLRTAKLQVADIKNNTRAISVLGDMKKEQESEVEKAKVVLEQKRTKLQIAMQERKTQEKLYENAFEEFVREENARESKEVDELTSYVYGKRTKEEGK
ncbi:MAG: flagellar export protein FliJ [Lachnospiraceae bacterium]|nr:flagellar export protein FliJ [Lachnospiraceae bacterium]